PTTGDPTTGDPTTGDPTTGDPTTGDPTVVPCEHVWDDGVVTVAPTYTTEGVKTYTCTVCGETKTEVLPKKERPTTGGGGGAVVNKYTVKFDTNGGSTIKSVTVEKNETVEEPAAPAKEGFNFEGWYTDKAFTNAYDFATKVTKNITLYAKWTEVPAGDEPSGDEPTTGSTFVDVTPADWFYASVEFAAEKKLMAGVSDTQFAPNVTLTRAMLVTVLYRLEGEPATNRSIPFADVDMGAYYGNAVSWAKQNGIVKGISENEFAPDMNITREQIAAIMHRYAEFKGYDVSAKAELDAYADANTVSDWALEDMKYAVGCGLMVGKTATTVNPLDNITRAEMAAIIHRFFELNK
ncbi:MAG: S-layer homology domain-containing protein, partial [Clostridia bacterium]|nr:S-layer homology domain-containing protein [Clostridia bacterium]